MVWVRLVKPVTFAVIFTGFGVHGDGNSLYRLFSTVVWIVAMCFSLFAGAYGRGFVYRIKWVKLGLDLVAFGTWLSRGLIYVSGSVEGLGGRSLTKLFIVGVCAAVLSLGVGSVGRGKRAERLLT